MTMKHHLTLALCALSIAATAQPPALTTSTPKPQEILCCADRVAWANAQDVVDSIALDEWRMLQTFNNHLNIGAVPASRRWTYGQLDSIALSTVTKNARRTYALMQTLLYYPIQPANTPCLSWYLTDSSACVNGTRSYTYAKLPQGCVGTPPGAVPPPTKPCTTAPPCTGYSTGTWGTCTNGTQTRTVSTTPAGCVGTPPASVAVPASSQPCSTNYSLTFSGQNPLSLPGCATVQPWQTVTISGATATVGRNTAIAFTSPQTGVKTIVLKNFAGTPTDFTWINDQVRIKGGKFVLASDNTKVLGTVPTAKGNATITFPSAVTITYLLGTTAYNTAAFTVEGIDLTK